MHTCISKLKLAALGSIALLCAGAHADSDDALPRYRPQQQISETLRSWGSTEMTDLLNAWQKDFARHHPQARFSNTLKGTETAQAALYTNVADFALMDREILTLERHVMLRQKHAYPIEIMVATGSHSAADRSPALAIFVHKDNPLSGISMRQVDGVFGEQRTGAWDDEFRWITERARGEQDNVRTWDQLGLSGEWATKPIQTYGYPVTNYSPRPGPMLSFRRAAFGGGDMWNANLAEYETGREITAALARDRYGIAYAPLADANPSVKAIALAPGSGGKFVELTAKSVASREYPLARSIYISITPNEPLPAHVEEFMRYVLSREGQAVVAKQGGYLPLPAALALKQLKKLD